MDLIEASRAIETPGSLLMMRRAEEDCAYQCTITKEPTGVPVSTSEQDSLREPRRGASFCGVTAVSMAALVNKLGSVVRSEGGIVGGAASIYLPVLLSPSSS